MCCCCEHSSPLKISLDSVSLGPWVSWVKAVGSESQLITGVEGEAEGGLPRPTVHGGVVGEGEVWDAQGISVRELDEGGVREYILGYSDEGGDGVMRACEYGEASCEGEAVESARRTKVAVWRRCKQMTHVSKEAASWMMRSI